MTYPGIAHGRANIGTGRANFLENEGLVNAQCGPGRAKVLVILGSIFFVFLNHA